MAAFRNVTLALGPLLIWHVGAKAQIRPVAAPVYQAPATGAPATVQSVSPGVPGMTPEAAAQSRARMQLTEALRRIGTGGGDANAHISAGEAAVVLEDGRAALSFFLRADSLSPNNARVKAGLGSAYLLTEQPVAAKQMFDMALRLGMPERQIASDLGFSYDLNGDPATAQRLYAIAMQAGSSDKLMRRLALSQGIAGDPDRAIQTLAPLLQRRDRAAWRDRAFILAMNGRSAEAGDIVDRTLPANVAAGLKPYLAKMNRLNMRQMALAVHYGQFPQSDAELATVGRVPRGGAQVAATRQVVAQASANGREPRFVDENGRTVKLSRSERERYLAEYHAEQARKTAEAERQRLAAAQEAQRLQAAQLAARQDAARRDESERLAAIQRQQAEARAVAERARIAQEAERQRLAAVAAQQADARRMAANQAAAAVAQTSGPSVPTVSPTQEAPSGITPISLPASTNAVLSPAIGAGAVTTAETTGPASATSSPSLADLVKVVEADRTPAPTGLDSATLDRIRVEKLREARDKERAEARRIAAATARADALAERRAVAADAKKKAEEAAARLRATPARSWVQIATGASAGGLSADYRRAGRRAVALFRGKEAFSAASGNRHRLLVGPFSNARDANAWLAKYRAAGGDGFIYSSKAGEEVEKLGG